MQVHLASVLALFMSLPRARCDPIGISDAKCTCVGIIGRTGQNTYANGTYTNVQSDFGAMCNPWDAWSHADCRMAPEAQPAWCADQWCYVDPCACDLAVPPKPASVAGAMFQGKPLYLSYATCGPKNISKNISSPNHLEKTKASIAKECATTTKAAVWGKSSCKCRGYSGIDGFITSADRKFSYAGDVGSRCEAWDKDVNPACTDDSPPAWCKEKWCYVDPCKCDIQALGSIPQKSDVGGQYVSDGKDVYYSYATCGGNFTLGEESNLPPGLCPCTALKWAMEHGVHEHPDWYPGLSANSSFAEFQELLNRQGHGNCTALPGTPAGVPAASPAQDEAPAAGERVSIHRACHGAAEGEKCCEAVEWARGHGIHEHPDWYPGLSANSNPAEFQALLNKQGHGNCPAAGKRRLMSTADVFTPGSNLDTVSEAGVVDGSVFL